MLPRTKRHFRYKALDFAVFLASKDDDALSICPGCIVDTAKVFEAYLLASENIAHSIEDAHSDNILNLIDEKGE